jgi:hypothetical protein
MVSLDCLGTFIDKMINVSLLHTYLFSLWVWCRFSGKRKPTKHSMQVYISGLPTTKNSTSFNMSPEDTMDMLKLQIKSEFPFLEQVHFRILKLGKEPLGSSRLNLLGQSFEFNVPTLGGKGGFGSNLRAQGVRMQNKKTENVESCRDLSGKRLAIVNEAQRFVILIRMADYRQAEPERKKAEQAKIQKKIKEGLKEHKTEKRLVEDAVFIEKRQNMLEVIEDSVAAGLKKRRQPVSKKPWAKDEDSDSE